MYNRITKQCYECVDYAQSCDGHANYAIKKINGKPKITCRNRKSSGRAKRSPLQLKGFHSLYAAKIRMGKDSLMAFVEAIVQTSDDVYAKLDKSKIKQYAEDKGVKI